LALGNSFEEGGDHHSVLNVTLTRLSIGLMDEERPLGIVASTTTMKVTTLVEGYNHCPTLRVIQQRDSRPSFQCLEEGLLSYLFGERRVAERERHRSAHAVITCRIEAVEVHWPQRSVRLGIQGF
jgi:hypothetical protein